MAINIRIDQKGLAINIALINLHCTEYLPIKIRV
jgi:hypothetical protein